MKRGVRVVAAFLALSALLGTSAFGAVTAVHVELEHHTGLGAAEHAHHPGFSPTHGHPHAHEAEASGHSHRGTDAVHEAQSLEHEHVLALTADLDRRADRSPLDLLSAATAHATRTLGGAALSSPRSQPARASPAARASPLSRRSVVLQV